MVYSHSTIFSVCGKLLGDYHFVHAVVAATEVEEIVRAEWRDLGMPETLWNCCVKEFGPLIVSIDTKGNNMFEENKVIFNQKKDAAYEKISKEVGFIK